MDNEKNEYSIQDIYYIFRKHQNLISFIFILTFLLSVIITFVVKPTYKSSSVIMVSQDPNSMSMLDLSLGSDMNYIENEIEILKSRSTSELVVKKLINSKHRNNLYLFDTKDYQSSILRKIFTLGILERINPKQELPSLLSDSLIYVFTEKLMEQIKVSNKRNTDAITISIESYDPYESELLVNTIVDVYKKRDLEWVTSEMSHLKNFLTDQLKIKEIELNDIEQQLKIYQEKEKIYGLDENSKLILDNLTDFESKYHTALASISIVKAKEEYLSNKLSDEEKELSRRLSNSINDRLFAIKNEISISESELVSAINQYGIDHNAVKEKQLKLKKLKSTIKKESRELIEYGITSADPILFRQSIMDSLITINSLKSNLISKADAYKKLVDEYELKLASLPEKILNYTRLERNRNIFSETYGFMMQKLEESKIGEASKIGKIRIIDFGIASENPVSPNKIFNLILGIFSGLFLGISISIIYEYLDNSIKTVEQIERRGLTLLAIIPAIGSAQSKKKTKKYINIDNSTDKLKRRLITQEDPKSPVSEAYRSLRTSMMFTKNNNKCRFILVSSPGPGEGKTTTISNLAITYANLGKKTLLIDSDLRKPVLHKVFNLEKTPGLTSFLTKDSNFNQLPSKTGVENLDVITSGIIPPNPSELLESNAMNELFKKAAERYDVVLFDSPPLIAVTDAFVILKKTDEFVLVVRAGITERGGLDRVVSLISQQGTKITGTVMNAISEKDSYGSGYYYNYYQYYYGEGKS